MNGPHVVNKIDGSQITGSKISVTAADQLLMLYLFAIIFSRISGILNPPIVALCTDVFDTKDMGTMMGFLIVSWGGGSTGGTYFAGLVFDQWGGSQYAFAGAGVGMCVQVYENL